MGELRNRSDAREHRSPQNSLKNGSVSRVISTDSVSTEYLNDRPTFSWKTANGLRVFIVGWASLPFLIAIGVAPPFLIYYGIVTFPDILISDMINSTPLCRSLYTTSLGLGCFVCILSWTETIRFLKMRTTHAELRRALDQYLATVWLVVCPATMLTVSFLFEESADTVVPNTVNDFIQWFMHVVSAAFIFVGFFTTAALYLVHIGPITRILELEPEASIRQKTWHARGLVVNVLLAAPIRALHMTWFKEAMAYPLLGIEVSALVLAHCSTVWGNYDMLAHLDATEPLLSWRNLQPSAWAGSFCGRPAPPQRVLSSELITGLRLK
jgi:hypothetical protein